ncbi:MULTISPECIES: hypothetical protein [unclassified Halorubrum]|uniref:hypothetical protein n=1 Tax=unclassified Halorubrum TaxID=2642239 RepID=UPI00113FCAFE|nr:MULTISPECIES: hypothetical protein [unclassified Halorubrum]
MSPPHFVDDRRNTTTGRHRPHPPTPKQAVDVDTVRATIAHLRRALTASDAHNPGAVNAALLQATMAIEETCHPKIAAALRTARGVDPDSRTLRRYIRQLLRRLIAVVNCWEPSE